MWPSNFSYFSVKQPGSADKCLWSSDRAKFQDFGSKVKAIGIETDHNKRTQRFGQTRWYSGDHPIKQIYTKPQNTLLTQTFSAMNIINPFLHYIQLLAHDNHSRLIMKNIEI